ncbi:L-aminoadipate-semialdehyde dehydrogenase [Laetiporus sulphureus 93-53]|uniref:L-aminoadipate-semialdehyde dehydrogenase n=1 Tax=Laetiporus sulphureus 93-53 TaxID=1314785 RepID=A0A165FB43_9APHY|nr:L-aminoadipate-semialdehyde dehydrogenase [Laetiporus sulphureus 93-53]KZT08698.1 L-aminoadipate-semialdehyde dehydrogenase [Laetiporus sulphureus 93-53]
MPAFTFVTTSLTELVAIRARDQPNDVAIYTGIDEPGPLLRPLTYLQVQRAVDRLCAHYATVGLLPPLGENGLPPPRTIAVLTSTAIDETLLEIALAKLGLSPLLLSVNNSVPAVAHLCKITQSTHLIYGSKFVNEAREAQKVLVEKGYNVKIVPDKRFPLWGPDGVVKASIKPFPAVLQPRDETDRVAVILHSSGSTGFPKPVYVTHLAMIANVAGFVGKTGFSALPVFHGFGHYSVFRCYYSGVPFVLMPPYLPLTSTNICKVIKAIPVPCPLFFAVPYVIKLLGETEEGVNALAAFESITFSGAPVPDDLGDRLTAAGANLNAIYGTTETGSLIRSTRDFKNDKAWNWLRLQGPLADYLVMEDRGSNTFESVVKDGWPAKIQSNRPDGSYATKDLFLRHPVHSNWYKYIGRLDDTLVQVLGEKTNPVPIELAIRGNSRYVGEAIVFGEGRPQVGCLILPSELGKDLAKDHEAFMEKVWSVIEDANAQAPTHSRILPEMVYILDYGTTIPQATKMSILRPACYAKFKDIIDSVYDRFENDSRATKLDLSDSELEDFILNAIAQTLGALRAANLTKTTDLFAFGVDSLQATRIRNICQKELELNGRTLGQNVVYENPSVEKLAQHIIAVRFDGDTAKSDEDQHSTMLAMIERWSARFELSQKASQSGQETVSSQQTIVLTGATGSLGAHILQQLVSLPSISRVICFSRAKSHADSLARLQESLAIRRLTLSPEEWTKVESFAANVNEDRLGLSSDVYLNLLSEVTTVIHNAWPVNFNMSVDSYDEHIGGALNLINLCLRSTRPRRPSFLFSSSIAARSGSTDPVCNEDFPSSPVTALGTGYGRSKWVVEKLCERAAQDTSISIGVLRIGQLVGDTENGVWNETEAWPLMFKSAKATGVLPRLDDKPQWLPVDTAGRAIAEIVTQVERPKAAVYHIVNPNTTASWDTVLTGLKQAGVEFEAVNGTEWLDRLEQSDADGERNPAIKLLPYYRNRFGSASKREPIKFSVDKTSKVAPSIANAPLLSEELVGKWVKHWRAVGFLD